MSRKNLADSIFTSFSDSSNNVCIEDSRIEVGYDAISLKSGWDEYGIAYDRPTTDVYIRRVYLQSSSGSSVAFGSEMSGGISNVHVEQVHIYNSFSGIEFRTTKGRGGYIKRIIISDVELKNTNTAFGAIGDCGSHPDDNFDPNAIPVLDQITLQGVIGSNITMAGNFTGLAESPFTSLCLFNVSLAIRNTLSPWTCSNVVGFSESVSPEPCPELESSSVCYSLLNSYGKSTDIWIQFLQKYSHMEWKGILLQFTVSKLGQILFNKIHLFLHSVGLAFPPVQSADYLYSLISSFMCKKIFGSDCTKQQKGVKFNIPSIAFCI